MKKKQGNLIVQTDAEPDELTPSGHIQREKIRNDPVSEASICLPDLPLTTKGISLNREK